MNNGQPLPNSVNLAYVEELLAAYLADPDAVSPDWRAYFEQHRDHNIRDFRLEPRRAPHSIFHAPAGAVSGSGPRKLAIDARQDHVDQLIRNYRVRGHMHARLDPLERPRARCPELEPSSYGLSEADLDQVFSARSLGGSDVALPLRTIIKRLQTTYCRYIGVQFMHIDDWEVRSWLQDRMEGSENRVELSREEQIRIYKRLVHATTFEEFIQTKFLGAKSFSLEGAESLIPLLDVAVERAGDAGIKEIVIGMAHRGRLNVLANIVGKPPRAIFREFADVDAHRLWGRGDVKYHLGYHGDWQTASGRDVHIALCFNPSHLEFVNPVALGRLRAKQDRLGDSARAEGMAILIHGDAAFAGEGIVQETLNLSELSGYRTGGTLHVIVNNQIGFTTVPEDSRSSVYASAIGKMLQIPIFHVNGEDPEAVAQVVTLAADFRQRFQRDAIIDMYCYRKRGHNETDEPAFTQPAMYRSIAKHDNVGASYLEHLLKLGGIDRDEAERIHEETRTHLEEQISGVREEPPPDPNAPVRPSVLGRVWKHYRGGPDEETADVETGVDAAKLESLLRKLGELPDGFEPHRTLRRKLLADRAAMAAGEKPLDWGAAEALALASLAVEGTRIRLSGQDSQRGTFSQRHAMIHDTNTGEGYMPLQHLDPAQAPVEIVNSPLSEAGVLGYEYGYSIAYPDGLVMWEAQFGDFVNAAQVIIDQFISSAEDKWFSLSGLVMLLPHGFEGLGPEHSSARLERFLQLAAEDNMQVVYPTTPAQYFHLLRRQVVRPWRKPLIIMTPKSLLRRSEVVSDFAALEQGGFQRMIADDLETPRKDIRRIICCTGKIYYDLRQRREELEREDVAIVRIEQLYPLSTDRLAEALDGYADGADLLWVQEEPENMGAWRYLLVRLGATWLGRFPVACVAREESASPATGSPASHKLEQEQLLARAFDETIETLRNSRSVAAAR